MATILVAEGDADRRRALELPLRVAGYGVVEAADIVQPVIVACTAAPELVLLDIELLGGKGGSVLKRYSEFAVLSSIPVVLLAGGRKVTERTWKRSGPPASFVGRLTKATSSTRSDPLCGTRRRARARSS